MPRAIDKYLDQTLAEYAAAMGKRRPGYKWTARKPPASAVGMKRRP